jgi:hypothetical protein
LAGAGGIVFAPAGSGLSEYGRLGLAGGEFGGESEGIERTRVVGGAQVTVGESGEPCFAGGGVRHGVEECFGAFVV